MINGDRLIVYLRSLLSQNTRTKYWYMQHTQTYAKWSAIFSWVLLPMCLFLVLSLLLLLLLVCFRSTEFLFNPPEWKENVFACYSKEKEIQQQMRSAPFELTSRNTHFYLSFYGIDAVHVLSTFPALDAWYSNVIDLDLFLLISNCCYVVSSSFCWCCCFFAGLTIRIYSINIVCSNEKMVGFLCWYYIFAWLYHYLIKKHTFPYCLSVESFPL